MASSSAGATGAAATTSSGTGFKLDIGCVERDEDRTDFLAACSKLDMGAIRELVEGKGVDVNSVDSVDQNCIHFVVCAAKQDHERQTRLLGYLTSVGADPNRARSTDGWTPVFLAAVFKLPLLLTALLENGAKTNVADKDGLTPLDWARKYRLDDVKELLENSRSKVPRSRFSVSGAAPATSAATSSSLSEDSGSEAASSASASDPAASSSSAMEASAATGKDGSSEACLLTAQ